MVKVVKDSKTVEFDDNHALQILFGPHNINLDRMEDRLGVSIVTLGNRISVDGAVEKVRAAVEILNALYKKAVKEGSV